MTRKDYVAIAQVLKYASGAGTASERDAQTYKHVSGAIARELAELMARDNPRFDRARFLAACGVQS